MITVPHCLSAATTVMMLATLSVAGDTSIINTTSDRISAGGPPNDRPGPHPCGLRMRTPYEPGKIPVVLIHGLWGSPQLWDRMIADLEDDRALERQYQFWTFGYASGESIPCSAHLLRQSLRRARRVLDPTGTDAAFDRMVVVGHSLGGILAKMMVQRSGPRLWQTVRARPIDRIGSPPEDCELLKQAFCYEPVSEVRRVVFIATPHRGSPLASGPLGGVGVRLCGRPSRFLSPDLTKEPPTSAGELAPGHPFLMGLCNLGVDSSVRSHSIIADLCDPPGPGASDGVVPYWSSHLEDTASELVVHGQHSCLNHPEVIREVGRILGEHTGIDPKSFRPIPQPR
jgi:pimeloyl-ACP methyl ester carboxylesterase